MNNYSAWITPDQAREAISTGSGRGVKIAVIDSGIELSHPALRHARLVDDIAFEVSGIGIVSRSTNYGIDKFGHGTAVAAAIYRVAPEAQIGSFRILDENNASKFVIIREAARLAIDRGYHILNCSIGSEASLEMPKLENIKYYKPWIDLAYRHGVHVVSACNNQWFRDPEWPGHFPSVITVNMAKIDGNELLFRWDISSDDFARHLVEFAARGVDVELPWKDGRPPGPRSGSSFAAACSRVVGPTSLGISPLEATRG